MQHRSKVLPEAPLTGIRVLEFCQVAAGPFCGMLLSDLGAEVIKIERPGGDGMRQWPPISNGYSENFASLNRNKKSVVLDLKETRDLECARALAGTAHVLIENNRPGAMSRLGLGYEVLCATNPALVYCSISAYGQSGPRAQEGGFDVVLQAVSGVMSVTGEPDGAPVKCGVPISDFSSGLYAASAITAALRAAEQSGLGSHLDVSLLGASLGVAALQTSEYFGSGKIPRKLGSAHPRNAPYQAFRARDGHFVMAAGNDGLWHAVCDVLGNPDIASDPRFETTALRAMHQDVLKSLIEGYLSDWTIEDALSRFRAAGVPCGPINDYESALSDPQVQAMGWVQPIDLPGGKKSKSFGPAVRINGKQGHIRGAPPALGADTEDVLAELAQSRTQTG